MRRTAVLVSCGAALLFGCGSANVSPEGTATVREQIATGSADISSEETATVLEQIATGTNGKGTVLGVLKQSGHLLTFVEFLPGLTGIVESGPDGESSVFGQLPVNATLSSLWRSVTSAPEPPSLSEADARATTQRAADEKAAAEGHGPPTVLARVGPHNETEAEESSFNLTFCPGAEWCVLGFLFANTSNIQRSPYTASETVGSEGTVNLNSNFYFWDSGCYFNFFEGEQCFNKWVPFFNATLVPSGPVINVHITGNSPGNNFVDLNENPQISDPADPTVGIAIQ